MKNKYNTSTLFPNGSLKTEKESPLIGILNQMGWKWESVIAPAIAPAIISPHAWV